MLRQLRKSRKSHKLLKLLKFVKGCISNYHKTRNFYNLVALTTFVVLQVLQFKALTVALIFKALQVFLSPGFLVDGQPGLLRDRYHCAAPLGDMVLVVWRAAAIGVLWAGASGARLRRAWGSTRAWEEQERDALSEQRRHTTPNRDEAVPTGRRRRN